MPSTVIHHFHYYPDRKVLKVTFQSGLVYEYNGVPPDVFEKMKTSFSKGKFLNEEIKGAYPYTKIDQ